MIKKIILSIVLILSFQASYATENDVYLYLLKYTTRYHDDVVVYCGISNNPERRVHEHVRKRTMSYNTFDTMIVFAGPMSRSQALIEEQKCVHSYPIPKLYQTYPTDSKGEEEKRKAIEEYESHYTASRLKQIENPKVIYSSKIPSIEITKEGYVPINSNVKTTLEEAPVDHTTIKTNIEEAAVNSYEPYYGDKMDIDSYEQPYYGDKMDID